MKNVSFKIFPIAPSKGLNPKIVKQQFIWRKCGRYDGDSTVQAGEVLEPIWWNRPLNSNNPYKKEADGIWSYNLPFLYAHEDFKTGYNILVNKNSIPLIIQLKLDPTWDYPSKYQTKLQNLAIKGVYNALIELGVNSSKLKVIRNDILYNGKKFMGTEEVFRYGYYVSCSIITLNYSDEKEIFSRLTGKYALARGITGIIEETNLFTKEQFRNKVLEKIKEILDEIP